MADRRDSDPIRRILFPLRSAVELFSDPRSPGAVTKAKEAAVLYDELIFEVGLLDVSITPNGGASFWIPPDAMTPELLDRSRRVNAVGSPMTLAIGEEDEPGVPAKEMRVFVEGQVSNAYLAEFHTGILDDLAAFGPDWVATIDIGRDKQPGSVGEPIYEAIRRQNFADFTDKELMPGVERFLRSFVYESFNRDATVAAALEASFTGTPLFAPMIARGGAEPELAGSEALSVVVGEIGALPWEAVIEFRDHRGSQEARDRLREFERLAIESDPRDAYEFMKRVGHEVNRGFRAAIEELAPNLPEELAKQVLLNGVATASVVGAPVAAFAGAASSVSASHSFNRSWIAAVMVLTGGEGR
jgi:hypothetical protein